MPNAPCPTPQSPIPNPQSPTKYFPGSASQNLHIKDGDNPHIQNAMLWYVDAP